MNKCVFSLIDCDKFVINGLMGFLVGISLLGFSLTSAWAQPGEVDLGAPGSFSLGGHVNTLATSLDRDVMNGNRADTGAVDINSVELGLTASPLKHVDANVVWLREEELDDGNPGDGFAVDQAFVTIAGNNRVLANREERTNFDAAPWYLKAGKMYSPFGTQMEYHTFDVVSEPQTLALSETLESSFLLGYTPSKRWNLYAGIFSGDGADSEDGTPADHDLDDGVIGADFNPGWGTFSVQWTNNINNSIALTNELGSGADENGGFSLYGQTGHGNWNLQVTHVTATSEYDQGTLTDSEPRATSVELTYAGFGEIFGRSVDGTLVYERTDEWVDHPEDIAGAVVDIPFYHGVTGSLEYLDRDYADEFSTGLDDEQLVSFQLSIGFSELIHSQTK